MIDVTGPGDLVVLVGKETERQLLPRLHLCTMLAASASFAASMNAIQNYLKIISRLVT